ncbi:GH19696 [Drosophila grimshawi]|uniref:GH19696 n=1 Tax=Drosophila grimshawi TaxID=7222 RepID=B4K016_DROGR|nr:GH19696 [Drosophila grimshawi]
MPQYKFQTLLCPALLICICCNFNFRCILAAPVPYFEDNLVDYPSSPSEVLPIEPLLIYPEPREIFYQARTANGDGERDIIFVKLLQNKLDGYHPKKQHLVEKPKRKELSMKDIFFVKARANGQFSHERLKVYRLPEFFAISVFRNDAKKM